MSKQRIHIKGTDFQPKNEYLLIKPEELAKEEVTESGFIIDLGKNRSSLARPSSGRVVAVGSDIGDIAEGDFVIWPETDGLDIEFNDGEYMILRYRSVIGMAKK